MSLRFALCAVLIASLAFALAGCKEAEQDRQQAKSGAVLAVGVDVVSTADAEKEQIILSLAQAAPGVADELAAITIDYPLNESIVPPEIVAATFLWHETSKQVDRWLIDVSLNDGSGHIYVLAEGAPPPKGQDDPRCFSSTNEPYKPTAYQASAKSWTPSDDVWAAIKAQSVAQACSAASAS